MGAEPYWVRIRRLRTEAGLSQPALYRLTEGVGFETVRALERPYEDQRDGRKSSSRYPSADTLARVARALGVEPATFPEYRLARARQLLDERVHGLDVALRCLEAFGVAQQRLAEEGMATEAQPTAATGRPAAATGPVSGSPEGEEPPA